MGRASAVSSLGPRLPRGGLGPVLTSSTAADSASASASKWASEWVSPRRDVRAAACASAPVGVGRSRPARAGALAWVFLPVGAGRSHPARAGVLAWVFLPVGVGRSHRARVVACAAVFLPVGACHSLQAPAGVSALKLLRTMGARLRDGYRLLAWDPRAFDSPGPQGCGAPPAARGSPKGARSAPGRDWDAPA